MPPKAESEVEKLILKLSKAQQEIEREDTGFYNKVQRVDVIARLLWFIGAVIFSLGVWATTMQLGLAEVRRELENRRPIVDRVNEMWWMKEHGVTNEQAFQKSHGIKPSNPMTAK